MTSFVDHLRETLVTPSENGISAFAREHGFNEFFLLAILNVESRGAASDSLGRMLILPEKHVFWRELPEHLRTQAKRAGLARPKWSRSNYKGLGGNGSDLRWDRLKEMAALHEDAALKACSYGKAQIMGFNHKMCGYDRVQDFVRAMASSEEAQDHAFFSFLINSGLSDDIRRLDVEAVVRVYNGPGQVERYSSLIRAEYHMLTGDDLFEFRASRYFDLLRLGSQGYQVRALQERLCELGYHCRIDGDFGTGTRRAVLAFQADNGLDVDGRVGRETHQALLAANPDSMPVKVARESLTIGDLRKKGSQTIKQADRMTVLGGSAVGVGVLSQAGDLFSNLPLIERLSLFKNLMAQVQEAVEPFLSLVGTNKWLALAAVGGVVVYLAWKIKQRRLWDAKTWRHVA
ncbi:N-acetylmuramidase domain-containing protein [Pseudovibrio exalbescens]|uniref:N-acetylmuramidase domain-containing protein n=1 Tax=Pseudovibrio exalbescens TaxID=197461 RepID=UPI002366930C|nr:N-acetylmuramidase domain-containing protein [Pseudovibrio exalbescens]MDD7908544.1 N-acetylmuramidase domain-containing protein [Pseudovibrio exalbescens]